MTHLDKRLSAKFVFLISRQRDNPQASLLLNISSNISHIQYCIFRSHQDETTLGLDSSHIFSSFLISLFQAQIKIHQILIPQIPRFFLQGSIIWNLNSIYANKDIGVFCCLDIFFIDESLIILENSGSDQQREYGLYHEYFSLKLS